MPAGLFKDAKIGYYTLDTEWRKKMPRRVQLSASKEKTFHMTSKNLTIARPDKTNSLSAILLRLFPERHFFRALPKILAV